MKRSQGMCAVVLIAGLAAIGCPKPPPKTAPDQLVTSQVPVAPPTTDIGDTTPAQPVADQTVDPWSQDIIDVNRKALAEGLLGDIYYDFNKDELRTDARDRLSKNAEFLKAHPQFQLTIEGHCDERGTSEFNLALGERRAAAARDYLVSLGVASNRLRTISYGEERPQCNDANESCWQLNRRAHFMVTGRTNLG